MRQALSDVIEYRAFIAAAALWAAETVLTVVCPRAWLRIPAHDLLGIGTVVASVWALLDWRERRREARGTVVDEVMMAKLLDAVAAGYAAGERPRDQPEPPCEPSLRLLRR